MITTDHPFQFVTQADLIELTGLKARNLADLLQFLENAPGAVIYYHTHHFLKQHQSLSPEPPNDFAYWVGHVLQEPRLGEQLAAIDTVRFPALSGLRDKITGVIKAYLAHTPSTRVAPDGSEFHLMKSQSFVVPTPHIARNLEEFLEAVKKVSVRSLYHHIFQAKLRLGKTANDFSHWFETELQEKDLAKAVAKLDPYTQTLDDLRRQIIRLVERRLAAEPKESTHAA